MSSPAIRVFIVDDQTIFRESVAAVLSLQKDFLVVGHAGSMAEARPLMKKTNPDVLLLDLKLPGQNGTDLLRELPELCASCRAIVSASIETEEDVVDAMRLGARGFLSKSASTDLYMKCIRKVHAGEVWLNGRMTEAVLEALSGRGTDNRAKEKSELSRRELEVIELVVQGYKNRDIAEKLFISEKTVKNHLSAIFNKLGVSDRLELTLFAFEKRFFPAIGE